MLELNFSTRLAWCSCERIWLRLSIDGCLLGVILNRTISFHCLLWYRQFWKLY